MPMNRNVPIAGPMPKSPPVSAPFQENWDAIHRSLGGNWCANSVGPRIWPGGPTAAPAYHRVTGAGAAIAQSGTGLTPSLKKFGDFCSRVTPGGGANSVFEQRMVRAASFGRFGWLVGRYVWASAWVWTESSDSVRLRIYDGHEHASSDFHSGTSVSAPGGPDADGWELLQVVKLVHPSASEIDVQVEGAAGADPYWVDGLGFGLGDIPHDYPHGCPARIGTYDFVYPGTLRTDANPITGLRKRFTLPGLILEGGGVVATAPTGAKIVMDFNKNGSTMFTTKPEIAIAATAGVFLEPDGTYAARCFARGDLLTADIDQVGSSVAGVALTAQVSILQFERPHERLLAPSEVD